MPAERTLLVEPVRRADGSLLSIYFENGEVDHVCVSMDDLKSGYSTDSVRLLGQGDFEAGLFVIGRALFEETELKIGGRVPFSAEIDEILKR